MAEVTAPLEDEQARMWDKRVEFFCPPNSADDVISTGDYEGRDGERRRCRAVINDVKDEMRVET